MLLVDGHVHLYDCFDVAAAFDAAAANFAAAAERLTNSRICDAVLCLVESEQEHFLDDVRAERQGRVWRGKRGFWELEHTAEPETLVVRRGATTLYLIAGRQLVTRERLEVLALATNARLPNGESLDDTLAAVREAGAAAVLPWGVGKWLGSRGALVARMLGQQEWRHVALGDNGNRLGLAPEPAELKAARRAGRHVLPGSDPLPLPGEEARLGSCGFAADVALDSLRPAAALLALLMSGTPLEPFGRPEALGRFLGNQLKLRLRGRAAAARAA